MAQTYFCMSCGNENSIKVNKCICGTEKGSVDIYAPVKYIKTKESEISSHSSFGTNLGQKFDFSLFETMAKEIEQEVSGGADEKDLGKWGAKTMDGLDLMKEILKNKNTK